MFTLSDIQKLSEKVYHHRLVDWQNKNYIERIGNGVYRFSDKELNDFILYHIANRLYEPSYISLETALSYYGLIPEMVYSITSVSSKKTTSFKTRYALFTYKKVKANLLFGYKLITRNSLTIKIAEPEKAILDFLYFQSKISKIEHIIEWRINSTQFKEVININLMKEYLELFCNKSLTQRVNRLLRWINNVES
ncbi:MAG: hypothetical protein N3A61_02470 [Ignavibacteria bacterium]|nr:hypothetical protein [Ignavibacteria bacterium]